MANLKEVVRRVKEAEKKNKVTKIPRVTRNVGLQITSTLTPVMPLGQLTPSPSPSLSEEVYFVIWSAAFYSSMILGCSSS